MTTTPVAAIALIDPLTLVGREIVQRLPYVGSDLLLFHTGEEDEHQIAEIGGVPRLVPPLSEGSDLESCAALVVASDGPSDRLSALPALLDRNPELPLVDVGRLDLLRERTSPLAEPAPQRPSPPAVRVAHPCLVAAYHTVRALQDLEPVAITLTALEPVSVHGSAGVEALARQAAARLRGEPPKDLVGGQTVAFSLVTLPSDELMEDAAHLLPNLQAAVTRGAGGWFHGHVAHLGMSFASPVDEGDLLERWMAAEHLTVEDGPLSLDAVADRETVLLGTPSLSPDRQTAAITAMVDGLLIGGALTALELLASLL